MSLASYPLTKDGTLPSSFLGWQNSVIGSRAGCLTLNTSEFPKDAVVCSLSDILETDVPSKYYLSPKACAGILRRAERRGKELPALLRLALETVVRQPTRRLKGGSGKRGFCDDLDRSGAFIPEVSKTLTSEGADGSSNGADQGMPIIAPARVSAGAEAASHVPGAHPGGLNGQDAYSNHPIVCPPVTSKWAKGSGGPSGDEVHNEILDFVSAPLTSRAYADNASQEDKLIAFHGSQDPDVSGDVTHPCGRNRGRETCVAIALRGREDGAAIEVGDNQAFALRASQGGGDKPMVFDTMQITRKTNRSKPKEGDPCHPLTATAHPPALVAMSVRRLTPRECERLQGFPDDWTRWDAAGKEISDSARYRMIGNAVTVTVAKLIGSRLVRAHTGVSL
jgi:hypothetical protein